MTSKLTIVATIEAGPGRLERPREPLPKPVKPRLAEPDCLQHDLHRNHDDPPVSPFCEKWQDRAPWQAQNDSALVAESATATAAAAAGSSLDAMAKR